MAKFRVIIRDFPAMQQACVDRDVSIEDAKSYGNDSTVVWCKSKTQADIFYLGEHYEAVRTNPERKEQLNLFDNQAEQAIKQKKDD